jgi:NAD(P)H-nitrite reductase large subunit
MTRHVIIGNGIAGINAAEAIRALDADASITMIARESFPPYSRPMISLVLQGSVTPEKLPIRGESFYEDNRVEALTGEEVISIDVDNRQAVTDKGSQVRFDRLLIATGADPRPIKADGLELGNLFFMRTESHVRGMLDALPKVKHALVLGGGLVGFKAAYGLMHRGVKVTMLIKSGHPLSMQLDPTAGGIVLDELISKGLDVRVGIEAVAFKGNGVVRKAQLSDGSSLECKLVVIGKGVLPANSFVPRDKIDVDLGIMVDQNLQTSVPGIYAAGDVAEAFDVTHRTPWVNAIWPVAVEQGRIAGMNMTGRTVSYAGSMGRNAIRVFDVDVLTGGVVNPRNGDSFTVVESSDAKNKTYRRLVLRDETLVGLAMVGRIEQGGVLLSLMQRAQPLSVDPERLLDPSFNYGQVLS